MPRGIRATEHPIRYFLRLEGAECYHVPEREDALPVSVLSVINHNLSARQFAEVLQEAAQWYTKVAAGNIEPTAVKEISHEVDRAAPPVRRHSRAR